MTLSCQKSLLWIAKINKLKSEGAILVHDMTWENGFRIYNHLFISFYVASSPRRQHVCGAKKFAHTYTHAYIGSTYHVRYSDPKNWKSERRNGMKSKFNDEMRFYHFMFCATSITVCSKFYGNWCHKIFSVHQTADYNWKW